MGFFPNSGHLILIFTKGRGFLPYANPAVVVPLTVLNSKNLGQYFRTVLDGYFGWLSGWICSMDKKSTDTLWFVKIDKEWVRPTTDDNDFLIPDGCNYL